MKKSLIITSLICSCGILCAQPSQSSSQSDQPPLQTNQSSLNKTNSQSSDQQTINEAAGAQTTNSSSLDSSTPPGRAFSTNNPPEGRPFQENPGLPPGQRKQQIKEGEQSGIPTQEPAGAERPNQSSSSATSTNSSSSVTGNEVISAPKVGGTAQGELRPGDPGYAAGAQRQQATQLNTALSQFKMSGNVSTDQRMQLQHTLTSMVSNTQNLPPEFITRLSEDLSTSLTKVEIKEEMRSKLANDIAVILSGQSGSQTEIQTAFTDAQTILLSGGTPTPQARATVCDLHLIASELVPNLKLNFAP